MEREFARWDDIDVHYRGEVVTSGGHGFAAMSRRRLLEILQQRCAELGVLLHFRAEAPDAGELAATHDLWSPRTASTPASGRSTPTRSGPTSMSRHCKYMWLGTDKVFDAFKFYVGRRRTA